MSRAAGAIRVIRGRTRPIVAQRKALTFTPAAIDRLKVKFFLKISKFFSCRKSYIVGENSNFTAMTPFFRRDQTSVQHLTP